MSIFALAGAVSVTRAVTENECTEAGSVLRDRSRLMRVLRHESQQSSQGDGLLQALVQVSCSDAAVLVWCLVNKALNACARYAVTSEQIGRRPRALA